MRDSGREGQPIEEPGGYYLGGRARYTRGHTRRHLPWQRGNQGSIEAPRGGLMDIGRVPRSPIGGTQPRVEGVPRETGAAEGGRARGGGGGSAGQATPGVATWASAGIPPVPGRIAKGMSRLQRGRVVCQQCLGEEIRGGPPGRLRCCRLGGKLRHRERRGVGGGVGVEVPRDGETAWRTSGDSVRPGGVSGMAGRGHGGGKGAGGGGAGINA